MKKLTKKQLEEIKNFMSDKGYLDREEIFMFIDRFGSSYKNLKNELLENKIPFKCGNLKIILLGFGFKMENNKVDFNDFISLGEWKLELFKNSKIRTYFQCQNCNLKSDSRLSKMINRKFFILKPICSKCINSAVSNNDEFKKINSEAQLIAQNRLDVKEKNRKAQLKRFEDPEVRKKHSESAKKKWKDPEYRGKMEKIAKEKWNDPEYARKVIQNSKNGGLKGVYKGLYYDSGYELAWLMILDSEGKLSNVERANLYIGYNNSKKKLSHYYPDFILDGKYLVEIKGYGPWADIDSISKKNEAAKIWCKSNNMKYRLVEFKDIGNFWYRKARNKHKELENGEIKK
jgi:hypothetical protein